MLITITLGRDHTSYGSLIADSHTSGATISMEGHSGIFSCRSVKESEDEEGKDRGALAILSYFFWFPFRSSAWDPIRPSRKPVGNHALPRGRQSACGFCGYQVAPKIWEVSNRVPIDAGGCPFLWFGWYFRTQREEERPLAGCCVEDRVFGF
jgi:hypothetical protein